MRKILIAVLLTLIASTARPVVQEANLNRGPLPADAVHAPGPDQVSLFNGSLTIPIQIGHPYSLNSFSYGITVAYNSGLWDHIERVSGANVYNQVLPNLHTNAGLGWFVTLGKLVKPGDVLNPANETILKDVTQAQHKFVSFMPGIPGDSYPEHPDNLDERNNHDFFYTRDGSFIRMYDSGYGDWIMEQPDGTIHRYGAPSGRLSRIEDRHGNFLKIEYWDEIYPITGAKYWRLTDSIGRVHYIRFRTDLPYDLQNGRELVDRIELQTHAGTAIYVFEYGTATLTRPLIRDADPQLPATMNMTLLTGILLPDGTRYSMTRPGGAPGYWLSANEGCVNPAEACRDTSGLLSRLTLPTGGSIEWRYDTWSFNPSGLDDPNDTARLQHTAGVARRQTLSSANAVLGTWDYEQTLSGDRFDALTTVTYPPGGDSLAPRRTTKHWFSTWTAATPGDNSVWGFTEPEYGLNLSRRYARLDNGITRFKSSELAPCAGCPSEQTNYASWATDGGFKRIQSALETWPDGTWASSDSSGWDGAGHYRQQTTGGNFPSGNHRIAFTNFNPDGLPAPTSPWLINDYDFQLVTEGSSTLKSQSCFDPSSPYLLRRRIMKDTSFLSMWPVPMNDEIPPPRRAAVLARNHPNDVVVEHAKDALGNVIVRASYGGDVQSLASGDLCSMNLPSERWYEDRRTYRFGTLESVRPWSRVPAAPMSFLTVDRTVWTSGFATAERDTAGVETLYEEYDLLGRLKRSRTVYPGLAAYQGDARVSTSYNPTQTLPRIVETRSLDPMYGTELAFSSVVFDDFGRVSKQRVKLPNGGIGESSQEFDANGWLKKSTQAGAAAGTVWSDFDAFGRPRAIVAPDGRMTTVSLNGRRSRAITVRRATAADTAGNPVETATTSTEYFDRQGRLWRVEEPAGANGAVVQTTYSYDPAGRVTSVNTTSGGSSQVRWAVYDGRGFLTAETNPEKNGTTYFGSFDPAGNPQRVWQNQQGNGLFDLLYTRDGIGRVTRVQYNSPAGWRDLKSFTYATGNSGTDYANGKLKTAVRHNWHDRFGLDVQVTETYAYTGRSGRVGSRTTSVSTGQLFSQSWEWNSLGEVSRTNYPSCGHWPCSASSPARSVDRSFTSGWLTSILGYASSIGYHPSGALNYLYHANGVTYQQQVDFLTGVRPSRLLATARSSTWDSGIYSYDGSGAISKIGADLFLYDAAGRLKEGSAHDTTTRKQLYGYDAFGNMTSKTTWFGSSASTVTLPTSPATNRLTDAGYDPAGNMTSRAAVNYLYDAASSLIALSQPIAGRDWVYVYTADDEKLWSYDLAQERSYWTIRDLGGKPLREWVNNGSTGVEQWSWSRDWVWRGEALLATHSVYGLMHVDVDHLGTPRLFTNASGYVAATQKFFPFGEDTGAYSGEPLRFTGHERASAYELYAIPPPLDYMHARWYSPEIGRFLSTDPIGGDPSMPGSFNRYSYVLNDPMNRIDPDGMLFRQAFKFFAGLGRLNGSITVHAYTDDYLAADAEREFARFVWESAGRRSRDASNFLTGFGDGAGMAAPVHAVDLRSIRAAWTSEVWSGHDPIDYDSLAYDTGEGWGRTIGTSAWVMGPSLSRAAFGKGAGMNTGHGGVWRLGRARYEGKQYFSFRGTALNGFVSKYPRIASLMRIDPNAPHLHFWRLP